MVAAVSKRGAPLFAVMDEAGLMLIVLVLI